MASFLDPRRPPVFCPGCAHERSVHALDRALASLGLEATDVVLVTDIGCCGLFDAFFAVHAIHGLHGRALTYAAGIKLARPRSTVVVVMGDGGVGIGGAHFLEACKRNLDLNLFVLNNFNFGMTGGQFSCTTPSEAAVSSGFLNRLEKPLDLCSTAAAAGAPFVARCSVYDGGLADLMARALRFDGFSLVDVWGPCPGRYTGKNPLKPEALEEGIRRLPPFRGPVLPNLRREYGARYREEAAGAEPADLDAGEIEAVFAPVVRERREVVFLGAAGNRVLSAGSLLAHAAALAGMHATQKNDFHITVLRGPSVSEIIVSPEPVGFTGVEEPHWILAVSREGVEKRRELFSRVSPGGRVIRAKGVDVPEHPGQSLEVDFSAHGIPPSQRALAALFLLARLEDPVTPEMLSAAVRKTLRGKILEDALSLEKKTAKIPLPFPEGNGP